MGSTNFSTHYSIPLPLGTDLTTPMDYNEAAEAVDTALFGAVTDAGNASDAAAAAVSTANVASEAVDTVSADLVQEKAKIVALQTRMTNAENEIDDVRADGQDSICAYNEPTATSTHAYAIGDYFFYNNTLYQTTASIAIGATITPDTNCETTNITSELIQINTALSSKQNKAWTLVGNVIGTTHIPFSNFSGYSELLLRFVDASNRNLIIPVPAYLLTTASVNQYFGSSAYQNESTYFYAQAIANANDQYIALNGAYENGTEITSTAHFIIFAR